MAESSAGSRVPVEERLFSLVLALLATETGLTKNEILSTVQGYRQRYKSGGDNANLERQFERDKDDIRELGVPLETVDSPGDAGNNQTLRYRIPRGAYELPHDLSFSSDETTLLNLAAMVWREGSLSGESRRALLKLRSLGVAADEPVIGYAPRVRLRDPAFDPLNNALERHLIVRFPYLKPGDDESREREVLPLALVQYQGRWHLSAEETDFGTQKAGEHKMFLLRRIVGSVVAGKPATAPEGDQAALALASLEEIWESSVAEVEVVCDTDAATRLANRRGTEEVAVDADGSTRRLRLHFVDKAILADELAGFGPEVIVLSPPELRDAVVERLQRTERDMAEFQARDKLAFLLSLVPWLMDHDGASVAEAAEHFGVSTQQIRDAVELIAVSGVPGDTDSYQHGDLFDINWDAFEEHDEIVLTNLVAIDDSPRFSAREATALIAGLQYLSSLPENAGSATLASLTAKLSRGASAAPTQVGVEESETDAGLGTTLALIRDSVSRGLQLELDYLDSAGQHERRRVDPLRVESFDDDWYLRGWCHLREAVRTFRLDRISDAVITDAPIEHRADEVRLPDRLFEASPDDLEVTIEVAPAAMPLLVDYIPDGATSTEVDGRIRTTLRVSHFHGLKRLIASMPGVATVVAPPSARAAVAEWAAAGAARYR